MRGCVADYAVAVRAFSRNARLYLLHVVGMDVIHGTWEVIFNLYLLHVGFGVEFVGLRLAVGGVARAVASVPMGALSDRIGRKAGFLLGDGVGAALALVMILTPDPAAILVASALAAAFGTLHWVTESPFIAENSAAGERVHLFSVATGLRTLAGTAGSLLAGFAPLWSARLFDLPTVAAYRWATVFGVVWWFASLIPAVLLEGDDGREGAAGPGAARRPLGAIRSWGVVTRLVVVSAIVALGGGFVVPLFNVFLVEGVHAHEHHVGTTFAAGSFVLAVAALGAPLLARRLGLVRSVVFTRLSSVPFVLLIAAAPALAQPVVALSVAGIAYVLRTALMNVGNPLVDTLTMDLLQPGERAATVGLQAAVGGATSALGSLVGSRLMAAGDFQSPFLAFAAGVVVSSLLYWRFFGAADRVPAAVAAAAPVAV